MALSCLRHYLNCSYISKRPLRYLMNAQKCSQFSTMKITLLSSKNDIPVKFTTSKGAKISIEETTGMGKTAEKYASKYERLVVITSLTVFLLYFCFIREENDIDEILKGNNQNVNKNSAELLDLQMKLIYCKQNNLPTDAIKARIAEIKKNNLLISSFSRIKNCIDFKIMIKGVFTCLKTKCYKRQIATRSVKVYKFLPAANKNLSASKESKLPPATKIDKDTVELLEKISLIGINSEKGREILEEAVQFANQIFDVDTTKVKPLVTVLEDESLYLREDVPKSDTTRSEIISHSEVIHENYFVTPLGNIEYIPKEKSFELPNLEKICKN